MARRLIGFRQTIRECGWKHCIGDALPHLRDTRVLLVGNMHPTVTALVVARTIPSVLDEPEVNVFAWSSAHDKETEVNKIASVFEEVAYG